MEKINSEVFLKVAELNSFKKAGDKLGYTQAGIAYIISSMEEELRLKLFHRKYGGVTLTVEGEQLHSYIRNLYLAEQKLREKADSILGIESGSIKILALSSILSAWMPYIVSEFQKSHPGISIDIKKGDTEMALKLLESNAIDIAIVDGDVTGDFYVKELAEDAFYAVLPLDHPMANEKIFPVKSFADYNFIADETDASLGVSSLFEMAGIKFDPVFTLNDDLSILTMVNKGLGIAVTPKLLIDSNIIPVKSLPLDYELKRKIIMITNKRESMSHATILFADFAESWVAANI